MSLTEVRIGRSFYFLQVRIVADHIDASDDDPPEIARPAIAAANSSGTDARIATGNSDRLRGPCSVPDGKQFEEFAQPVFLVSAQQPRLHEHALDHASCLIPISVEACAHKIRSRGCPRAMGGDDIGNDRRKIVHGSHEQPPAKLDTEKRAYNGRARDFVPRRSEAHRPDQAFSLQTKIGWVVGGGAEWSIDRNCLRARSTVTWTWRRGGHCGPSSTMTVDVLF
jgi:hypothetical protein